MPTRHANFNDFIYFCVMSTVRAKKSLGQHFLRDQNIARKITSSLLPLTRPVLEIGPGMGVLTRYLLDNPAISLRAIDIDKESIEYLHETFPAHKEQILYGDFLKMDIGNLFQEPFSIIGNLPYNISSQIFFRIIRHRQLVTQAVCMIQKEVAERIAAHHGNKDYGKSICMAVGACFDTDCNGATVGSVLGTAIGYNAIPSYWKDRVNDTLESTLAGYGSVSIGDMAEKTLGFIKKN